MEEKKEIVSEILVLMQKKYAKMLEIDRLTTEIAEVLSRDDRESVQLLLGMRQDEMDEADQADGGIRALLEAAGTRDRIELKSLLNGEAGAEPSGFQEQKIVEISSSLKKTLAHTVSVDRVLSHKLAGKDSYYEAEL